MLARDWELEMGAPIDGGTASYVTEATDSTGRRCVLKVAMIVADGDAEIFERSVLCHQLAAGEGCVEMLASHGSVPAMLLERLGSNLDQLAMPVDEICTTIVDALEQFWRPVVEQCALPSGAAQAVSLGEFIESTWEQLQRPCERAVIERAIDYCGRRVSAFDLASAVLVHGDAHGWNTLAVDDEASPRQFRLIDPEGLISERAHDLGVVMREYNTPLLEGDTPRLARRRAEMLATLAGADVDPEAVWQWGFIERVSTGLACLRDFEGNGGLDFLEVARRCL